MCKVRIFAEFLYCNLEFDSFHVRFVLLWFKGMLTGKKNIQWNIVLQFSDFLKTSLKLGLRFVYNFYQIKLSTFNFADVWFAMRNIYSTFHRFLNIIHLTGVFRTSYFKVHLCSETQVLMLFIWFLNSKSKMLLFCSFSFFPNVQRFFLNIYKKWKC